MHFTAIVLSLPVFLAFSLNAAPVPCESCSASGGDSIPQPASPALPTFTAADVDQTLQGLTRPELAFVNSVIATLGSTPGATVRSVVAAGARLYSWTAADLEALSSALDTVGRSPVQIEAAILSRAGITSAFTAAEAQQLKSYIPVCISVNSVVPASDRAALATFAAQSLADARCTADDLTDRVSERITALDRVVGALKLDPDTCTCNAAAAAVKQAMRAYIQNLSDKVTTESAQGKSALGSLLEGADAWIAGKMDGLSAQAAAVLDMGLETAKGFHVCRCIIKALLKLSPLYDILAALCIDSDTLKVILGN